MKYAFTVVLVLGLLAGSPAFAENNATEKTDTATTPDANQPDPAKEDAMLRTDATAGMSPLVKLDSHRTRAMLQSSVPPPPDGNELALSCKTGVEGFDAGYCLGVVEGVIASMRVCKPDHSVITLGEAADAIEKYLDAHPNKLHDRDVVVTKKALAQAFPCGTFESAAGERLRERFLSYHHIAVMEFVGMGIEVFLDRIRGFAQRNDGMIRFANAHGRNHAFDDAKAVAGVKSFDAGFAGQGQLVAVRWRRHARLQHSPGSVRVQFHQGRHSGGGVGAQHGVFLCRVGLVGIGRCGRVSFLGGVVLRERRAPGK